MDGAIKPKAYTLSTLPLADGQGAGAIIYVSDASGGGVPAFSDGTSWRRMTDRSLLD